MPKRLKKKAPRKFKPRWYKATVHSTDSFWNTKCFVATGKERYRDGSAYFIDEHGFRHYCVKFLKGLTVYIDPERTHSNNGHVSSGKSGRQLLERFYQLKLKPIAFKWYKAKNSLDTAHWLCVYPAHFAVKVEKSEDGVHVDNHLAILFYRSETKEGWIPIAQNLYEGHIRGNHEYAQPDIIQETLREWRLGREWIQQAITKEAIFDV